MPFAPSSTSARSKAPVRGSVRGGGPLVRTSLLLLLIALVVSAAVRVRVASTPLERDEGEYAYAGQLIREGIPPYRLTYNMKFPGPYYAYAAIMSAGGETPEAIRHGLLLVVAGTTVLIFLLAQRLFGDAPAATSAAAFALLALDRGVLGIFAHATHFVVLFSTAGLLLLFGGGSSPTRVRLTGAGACFGLAIAMKQHAVAFLLPGWILCLFPPSTLAPSPRRDGSVRCLWLGLGAALPLVLMVAVLAAGGVLDRFWFWTVDYAWHYVTALPAAEAVPRFATALAWVTRDSRPIWLGGALGLAALPFLRGHREARYLLPALAVASLLSLSAGFYFREHYFILALPIVALGVGAVTRAVSLLLQRSLGEVAAAGVALGLVTSLLAGWVVGQRDFLFRMTPRAISRSCYGANPFVEAPAIARQIAATSPQQARIAVFGSEPEIFFLAQRRSASGYIYVYPLMEPQPYASTMQREMIQEVEASQPEYVVFVQVPWSWLPRPGSDQTVLRWGQRFVDSCYELIGVTDVFSDAESAILWDDAARAYQPRSANLVLTYRRRVSGPCLIAP